MDSVSRPLIALLLGTVVFFALWMTMLKPSPKTSGGSQSANAYQSAINKAHQAVGTSNAASVTHGGTVVTASHASTAAAKAAAAAAHTATTARATVAKPVQPRQAPIAKSHAQSPTQRHDVVVRALSAHRVLALLFYNPAEADDRAVRSELSSVPARRGKVVKLAIPLNELTRYTVITNQVQVNQSPTLVLVDGRGQAETIIGFADRFEIAQRVDDALAVH